MNMRSTDAMSGQANVLVWLRDNGIGPSPTRVTPTLEVAQLATYVLSDDEIIRAIQAPEGKEAAL
jgi:hypothetical protein